MSALSLALDGDRRAFRPGETLSGSASWTLDAAPDAIEVRLFWRTSGRGTEDLTLVEELSFARPAARERRSFRFSLPAEPYSFSGKLVALTWMVEVVALPSDASTHETFVLSPTGAEIVLPALEEDEKAKTHGTAQDRG